MVLSSSSRLFTSSVHRFKGLGGMVAIRGALSRKPVCSLNLLFSEEAQNSNFITAISFSGSKNTPQNLINGPSTSDLTNQARLPPRLPTTLPGRTLRLSPSFMPAQNKHSSHPTAHPHTSSTSLPTSSPHF